jgi:hypothetical protein
MIIQMFSIFDTASKFYEMPLYAHTEAEARRHFTKLCNQKDQRYYEDAQDYTLFHIGEYDNITGLTKPLTTPVSLVKAIQVKEINKEV